jgi:hypothetical protein
MVGRLGGADDCHFDIKWPAPSARLVANPHKIAEPVDSRDELKGKDALDILRLVRAVPIERLAGGLRSPRRQGAERRRPDGRSFSSGTSSGGRQPRVRDGIPCSDHLENEDTIREFEPRSAWKRPRERAGQRPEQAGGAS